LDGIYGHESVKMKSSKAELTQSQDPANLVLTLTFQQEFQKECIDDIMVIFMNADFVVSELVEILIAEILVKETVNKLVRDELERVIGPVLRSTENDPMAKKLSRVCRNLIGMKEK